MFYLQYIKKIIVFIGFILSFHANAGLFEDFHQAVRFNDLRTTHDLLQRGMDPNSVSPDGVPLVLLAIQNGAVDTAKRLIAERKFKTEVRNPQGETALMLACLKGQLPVVEALLARDADINMPGWTPLHYAATGGHEAIVALLLDKSAYIDAESPNGSTPLMMAAMYGDEPTVKLLIDSGADLTLRNQKGLTALDFAVSAQHPGHERLIREAAKRLQESTAPKTPGQW